MSRRACQLSSVEASRLRVIEKELHRRLAVDERPGGGAPELEGARSHVGTAGEAIPWIDSGLEAKSTTAVALGTRCPPTDGEGTPNIASPAGAG